MRHFQLGEGVDSLHDLRVELDEMTDVLMGRVPPPVDRGILTLHEVADAYYARAKEMEGKILQAEADGTVLRGTKTYKFRTGQLRSFIEMAKGAAELGSRRVTAAKFEHDMERGAF